VLRRKLMEGLKTLKKREDLYSRWKRLRRGIPIIDGLANVNRVVMLREAKKLMSMVCFYCVFLWICMYARGFQSDTLFKQNQVVKTAFLGYPAPPCSDANGVRFDESDPSFVCLRGTTLTFENIGGADDVWYWLLTPFLDTAYQGSWYNDDPIERKENLIMHSLRLIGGVRIRQVRVHNDSCVRGVHAVDSLCFGDFGPAAEATGPHPCDARGGGEGCAYTAGLPSSFAGARGYADRWYDQVIDYGNGGYIVEINETNARERLERLQAVRWIDDATRAVLVEFNLYSTETRYLSTVRVTFELFSSGFLIPSFTIRTVQLEMYDFQRAPLTTSLRFAGEIFFVIFVALFWSDMAKQIMFADKMYRAILDGDFILDVIFQLFVTVWAIMWFSFAFNELRTAFEPHTSVFVDMWTVAELSDRIWIFAVIIGILGGLKVFKYLSISPTMYLIATTLTKAMVTIIIYFVAFLVINVGFALAGLIVFGHATASYRNPEASFFTITRFVLGDFDYAELSDASPEGAPLFFYLYTALMSFVQLNLFIAIVITFFDIVRNEDKIASEWRGRDAGSLLTRILDLLRKIFWKVAHVVCVCYFRRQAKKIKTKEEEIRKRAKRRGEAVEEIERDPRDYHQELMKQVRDRIEVFEGHVEMAIERAELHGGDMFSLFNMAHLQMIDTVQNSYISMDELCAFLKGAPPPDPRCARFRRIFWCTSCTLSSTEVGFRVWAARACWVSWFFGCCKLLPYPTNEPHFYDDRDATSRDMILNKELAAVDPNGDAGRAAENAAQPIKSMRDSVPDEVVRERDWGEALPNGPLHLRCSILRSDVATLQPSETNAIPLALLCWETGFGFEDSKTHRALHSFSFREDYLAVDVDPSEHSTLILTVRGLPGRAWCGCRLPSSTPAVIVVGMDSVDDALLIIVTMRTLDAARWQWAARNANAIAIQSDGANFIGRSRCPHVDCAACKLLEAYNDVKEVLMVGAVDFTDDYARTQQRIMPSIHNLVTFRAETVGLFEVKKKRVLVVDKPAAQLTLLEATVQLKFVDRINLASLVQQDLSSTSDRIVCMKFEEKITTGRAAAELGAGVRRLEITFIFPNPVTRTAFVETCAAAIAFRDRNESSADSEGWLQATRSFSMRLRLTMRVLRTELRTNVVSSKKKLATARALEEQARKLSAGDFELRPDVDVREFNALRASIRKDLQLLGVAAEEKVPSLLSPPPLPSFGSGSIAGMDLTSPRAAIGLESSSDESSSSGLLSMESSSED
tara:strand:+ start:1896 stop:5666 length:3771 start_codon:yes stop_codon:yes gene_type:complete